MAAVGADGGGSKSNGNGGKSPEMVWSELPAVSEGDSYRWQHGGGADGAGGLVAAEGFSKYHNKGEGPKVVVSGGFTVLIR